MIDIESLGKTPGCCLLSIGATYFDLFGSGVEREFYAKIDFSDMKAKGFFIDPETVAWWKTQSEEAKQQLYKEKGSPIDSVLIDLSLFPKDATRIWCQGANFDAPILDATYTKLGLKTPWNFWDVRDTRTIYDVFGFDTKTLPRHGTYHNALDDCKFQVHCIQSAIQSLGQG